MIIYEISGTSHIEWFQGLSPPPTTDPIDIYRRHFNELDNVNDILKRPVEKGDPVIDKVQPVISASDTDTAMNVSGSTVAPYISSTVRGEDRFCLPKNHPIYDIIKARQPHIFDKPEIIQKDGELFYHDWRYPRHPINVKFAVDPEGYCRANPGLYPCTVIASRNSDHS